MKPSSPTYVWANELVSQIIEGACDSFLIVAGGSAVGQAAAGSAPAMTPALLWHSVAIGAAIYGASYLKKHPLPTVTVQSTPVINPPAPPAP